MMLRFTLLPKSRLSDLQTCRPFASITAEPPTATVTR